ncbi:MAG: capsular biosynthesis protein [Variovorax paradoxus]|uniref:Putative tyrosine-protein kinase EpsB n=1 Tax=Variovorax paradoxus TaxID=34073 RepID=A0A2W5QB07_VARPD|nr:MAG: capsular biosynthesis protein [Variovorax paradoxus]
MAKDEIILSRSLAAAKQSALNEELKIGAAVGAIVEFKWLIMGIMVVAIFLGAIVAYVRAPLYRADALVQVDEKSKSRLSILKDIEPMLADSTSMAAELEILGSRLVLGRAVKALNLDVEAEPRYFPLVGRKIAALHDGLEPQPPLAGLSRFAWGGEELRFDELRVPFEYEDERLRLVAGESGAYSLIDKSGRLLVEGQSGQKIEARGFVVRVARLKARPGTNFNVVKSSEEEAIAKIRRAFSARERNKGSGIIEVALTGLDSRMITVVLTTIVDAYYQQNLERKAAETANQLAFLEQQLPSLKAQVDATESAYNAFQQSRGTVDLAKETEGVLKSLVDIDTELGKLQQDRVELRQSFTAEHPRLVAVNSKIALLQGRRATLDKALAQLPDTQQTAVRLKREMDVSAKLYMGLLATAQQLAVSKAGTVGEVRVIDAPKLTRLPIEPKRGVILAMSGVAGVVLSLVAVAVIRLTRVAVDRPAAIEKGTGLKPLAIVPHSNSETAASRKRRGRQRTSDLRLPLSASSPEDDATESFRSLRTLLNFAMADHQRKSIQLVGSKEDIGKTFVATNLAVVMAQVGRRVVLVDADVRRGQLHRDFGMSREDGVSEYALGKSTLAGVVRQTPIENLCIVTTGRLLADPSQILVSANFEEMIQRLEASYDLVVIDTAPVLAVSDACIIGRKVGLSVLVTRSERHPIDELVQTVDRLDQAGVKLLGFVFNDLDVRQQRYRYGYEGHVYAYRYQTALK